MNVGERRAGLRTLAHAPTSGDHEQRHSARVGGSGASYRQPREPQSSSTLEFELCGDAVDGLGAAFGAAHGDGALDSGDDERGDLFRLLATGAVLAERRGEQPPPSAEHLGGGLDTAADSVVGRPSIATAGTGHPGPESVLVMT